MQQTSKYKFNLIETSDPFSPNALNDNAQKLEDALLEHETAHAGLAAQIVQAREENCLVKLTEPLTKPDGTNISVDLSDLDFSKYRAFMAFVRLTTASNSVSIGGVSLNITAGGNFIVWLANFGVSLGAVAIGIAGGTNGGGKIFANMNNSGVWGSNTKFSCNAGVETAILYGIKN